MRSDVRSGGAPKRVADHFAGATPYRKPDFTTELKSNIFYATLLIQPSSPKPYITLRIHTLNHSQAVQNDSNSAYHNGRLQAHHPNHHVQGA